MMPGLKRLLVVSHVIHYSHEGKLYAYGPYSREIDIWADLFPEVVIASPCRNAVPPLDCLPFTRKNISIEKQIEAGGDHWTAKVKQLALLPFILLRLMLAMSRADAIHVRCPGNLGMFGCMFAPIFCRYRIAKFAGQWNGYQNETKTVRLQRALLKSKWWGAPVTVYGNWPNQPSHVVAFFTSMMTGEQVRHAVDCAQAKRPHRPMRILFSGRLVPEKRVSALLEALAVAEKEGLRFETAVVGDGIERTKLEAHARELGIGENVKFVGALPFDESLAWNEWADCLVLPSQHSEGWPKVIAEAMCYGVVCIGVDHGQVGRMLEGRGILLHEGNVREIAEALIEIDRDHASYSGFSRAAAGWAKQYSIDGLRSALAKLLEQEWKVAIESNFLSRPSQPSSNASGSLTVKNDDFSIAQTTLNKTLNEV